jgi:hypothetical protein
MHNNYDVLNCIISSNNRKHIFSKLLVINRGFFSVNLNPSLKGAKGSPPQQPNLEKVSGTFVSGFLDAEGTLIVSIYRRPNIKVG